MLKQQQSALYCSVFDKHRHRTHIAFMRVRELPILSREPTMDSSCFVWSLPDIINYTEGSSLRWNHPTTLCHLLSIHLNFSAEVISPSLHVYPRGVRHILLYAKRKIVYAGCLTRTIATKSNTIASLKVSVNLDCSVRSCNAPTKSCKGSSMMLLDSSEISPIVTEP